MKKIVTIDLFFLSTYKKKNIKFYKNHSNKKSKKKEKFNIKKNILINWHTQIVIQNKKSFFSSLSFFLNYLLISSNSCFVFVLGFEALKAHEYLIEKLLPRDDCLV